jgi:anti-sigma regulatory factor (Ser/Thr protein kinase)
VPAAGFPGIPREIRAEPTPPTGELIVVRLAADPHVVAAARRHAIDISRDHLDDERCQDVALAVSELVTNAIRHGGEPVTLTVFAHADRVRIEVTDGSPDLQAPGRPDILDTGRRGLRLVDAVCRDWGWHPVDGGKCVWCEV